MKRKFLGIMLACLVACTACGSNNDSATIQEQEVAEETVSEEVSEEAPAEAEDKPEEPTSVAEANTAKLDLADGVYEVDFTTDSSMFHVNEALNDKGTLTVKDGVGTVHISLTSKNIVNLYPGLAADAEGDTEGILQPTVDTVEYDDGTTEEVNGFDVPVAAIDEEFDLALIGTKGSWYDHKVKVSNPVESSEEE